MTSISSAFAQAYVPSGLHDISSVLNSDTIIDWIDGLLEEDPDQFVIIYSRQNASDPMSELFFIYVCQADLAVYFSYSNQNVAINGHSGFQGKILDKYGNIGNITNQVPGNNSQFVDGVQYWFFDGLNNNSNYIKQFYCSIPFKSDQGDKAANLDLTELLPPPYIFNADLDNTGEVIICEVNFNPHVYSSFVTVWGYNEYCSILYIYSSDEYNYLIEDEEGEPATYFFYLDVGAITSAYLGSEYHIASISCFGWEDGTEITNSVDWNFTDEKTPGDYSPPDDTFYYNTYYNESYHYSSQNGAAASFGFIKMNLSTDPSKPCFWDSEQTLVQPYRYSFVAIPNYIAHPAYISLFGHFLDSVLPSLCLSYDVVLTFVEPDVFQAIYGVSNVYFYDYMDFTNEDTFAHSLSSFYGSYPPLINPLEWSYRSNPPTSSLRPGVSGCYYTNSFFSKSLLYLLGDSNERLLEFESRLVGQDGAFQVLLSSLKDMYDNDYGYYTKMLTYMSKLDYLVRVVSDLDYFNKVLNYLEQISSKDFEIELPEFDFSTVLGKYSNSNISILTGFINDSVHALPSWDYSSITDFKTSISDLFSSASPSSGFIENISEPFSFGDEVADDLFPE